MRTMLSSWQMWALLSAGFAALTAVFAKVGVDNINSDYATLIRTIVILGVAALIVTATGQWQAPGAVSSRTYLFLVLSGLATGASWLIIAFFFRYSSLASLVAAFFAPAYYVLGGKIAWPLHRTVLAAIIVMSLLLAWRHRENIRRLLAGTESKLGSKAKPT